MRLRLRLPPRRPDHWPQIGRWTRGRPPVPRAGGSQSAANAAFGHALRALDQAETVRCRDATCSSGIGCRHVRIPCWVPGFAQPPPFACFAASREIPLPCLIHAKARRREIPMVAHHPLDAVSQGPDRRPQIGRWTRGRPPVPRAGGAQSTTANAAFGHALRAPDRAETVRCPHATCSSGIGCRHVRIPYWICGFCSARRRGREKALPAIAGPSATVYIARFSGQRFFGAADRAVVVSGGMFN